MIPGSGGSNFFSQYPDPFSPMGGVHNPFPLAGNPANTGTMPNGINVNTGIDGPMGMIANMGLSMVASTFMQSMGIDPADMPSFGRTDVSDYQRTAMKQRQAAVDHARPFVVGSNPALGAFGDDLGSNSLFQSLEGMLPGGSSGAAFEQVYSRMGSRFAGPGASGAEAGARMSAEFVRNMDNNFSDDDGMWDYGSTAGFNKGRFVDAVTSFSSTFGTGEDDMVAMAQPRRTGDAKISEAAADSISELINKKTTTSADGSTIIEVDESELERAFAEAGSNSKNAKEAARDLAGQIQQANESGSGLDDSDLASAVNTASGGNSKEIDAASGRLKEIAEVVREAGNFFGSDMPFAQLMEEIKNMQGTAVGVSAADIQQSLQSVQAMAVAVDMSNEAFGNYMKVISQIKKTTGGVGSSRDLAIDSMMVGKAIEEQRKQEADARGEIYTGPGAQELAMDSARIQEGRQSSVNMVNAKAIISTIGDKDGEASQKMVDAYLRGDAEAVMEIYAQEQSAGNISGADSKRIFDIQRGHMTGETPWNNDDEEAMVKAIARKQGVSVEEARAQVKDAASVQKSAEHTLKGILEQGVFGSEYSDDVSSIGGKDFIENAVLKDGLVTSGAEAADAAHIEEGLIKRMEDKFGAGNITEQQRESARKVAQGLSTSLREKVKDRAINDPMLANTDPEVRAKREQIEKDSARIQEEIKTAGADAYNTNSDQSVAEAGLRLGLGAYKDLQKKAEESGGSVGFNEFWSAIQARGQEAVYGSKENAQRQFEMIQSDGKISARIKELANQSGIDPEDTSASAEDKQRMEEIRGKAIADVLGKDSYAYRDYEERQEFRKEAEKKADVAAYSGSEREQFIQSEVARMQQEAREKEGGTFDPEGKGKPTGSERREEEDAKNQMLESVLKGMEESNSRMEAMQKSWADSMKEIIAMLGERSPNA